MRFIIFLFFCLPFFTYAVRHGHAMEGDHSALSRRQIVASSPVTEGSIGTPDGGGSSPTIGTAVYGQPFVSPTIGTAVYGQPFGSPPLRSSTSLGRVPSQVTLHSPSRRSSLETPENDGILKNLNPQWENKTPSEETLHQDISDGKPVAVLFRDADDILDHAMISLQEEWIRAYLQFYGKYDRSLSHLNGAFPALCRSLRDRAFQAQRFWAAYQLSNLYMRDSSVSRDEKNQARSLHDKITAFARSQNKPVDSLPSEPPAQIKTTYNRFEFNALVRIFQWATRPLRASPQATS